jgi:hypothetical protein
MALGLMRLNGLLAGFRALRMQTGPRILADVSIDARKS